METSKPGWVTEPHPSCNAAKTGGRVFRQALRLLGFCLPGDWVKTIVYRSLLAKPRKLLYQVATGFYRFDHVIDVLQEFAGKYAGPLTVLEFGTAQGYATAKLLYATRYLGLEDRVTVHGFDSFEGLPTASEPEDRGLSGNDWIPGSYRASYETLRQYCEREDYRNCRLHAGYFEDTLTDALLAELREVQPILVWVDCDLYTSSRTVMERLMPVLPTGCVVYFDDVEFNYGSRFTGQARLIHETSYP